MSTLQSIPGTQLTDYLYSKADRRRIPFSGTFELSPVCNFSCRMCYVRKTAEEVRKSPRPILTLEDWRRIAREARDAGMLHLLLTGGEPLLWPDFWTLYEELIDMGFLISINTNGSLIDERAIARFRQRPPQRINVTLYGAGDESYRKLCGVGGVHTRVDRAVRGLQAAGIPVKLNCSLTPENEGDLDAIIDYAKERDAVLAVATYMFPPVRRDPAQVGVNERFTPEDSARHMMHYLKRNRGPEAYASYLRAIRRGCAQPPGLDEGCIDPLDGKVRCRAGKSSFWITWDGWMTSCGMMPEPKADLKELGFAGAWRSVSEAASALCLSGVCSKCPNYGVCHPCAAVAYAETGDVSGIPAYMCRATQEMHRIAEEEMEVTAEER